MPNFLYKVLKVSLFFLYLLLVFGAGAQQKDTLLPLSETIKEFQIGSTTVLVQIQIYGTTDSFVFINLHDDETTSVKAAQNILQRTGGMLIRIINNNQRRVPFSIRNECYDFDPNRIFSEARSATIDTIKGIGKYFNEALVAVKNFSVFLLQQIPSSSTTLVALHNNKPDKLLKNAPDTGLHIYSYLWPRKYHEDAVQVHVNTQKDPDDFFFTTDLVHSNKLSALGFNVVLQSAKAADDGSLSVYYGLLKKSYFNIEAEHNHFEEQRVMVATLLQVLKEVNHNSSAD